MFRSFQYQKITLFFLCFLAILPLSAKVDLAAVFTDNMVLQQQTTVSIWGKSSGNREIKVITSWDKKSYLTIVDATGKWLVKIKTPKAGGPYFISISDGEEIQLNNILIGEVWICSGQSNMDFPMLGWTKVVNAKEEVALANYPKIRLLHVNRMVSKTPQDDLVKGIYGGGWRECSPETIPLFSAVAYFFGRNLYENLNVPVGLIYAAWGGSNVISWTSGEMMETVPDYMDDLQKTRNLPEPDMSVKKPNCNRPTYLYNGMIHPLVNYAIRGAIWYQGEQNSWTANQYKSLFPLMIQSWREAWKNNFPFYYVQLTNFVCPDSISAIGFPVIRDAQLQTLHLENTGMAVTIDIGDSNDIHPTNKQDVGKRLALWALAKTYGKKITYSGPIYESYRIEGDKIRIGFTHTDKGLIAKGAFLKGFTIAGIDEIHHSADARIEGNTVVVGSPDVKHPLTVRYGWKDDPECNLSNGAGLPASPFKTDNEK
jgi:sialate O-acetylesterase